MPIVQTACFGYAAVMRKIVLSGLSLLLSLGAAQAAEQSRLPADQTVQQNVSRALIQAGIDLRRTSIQVITTSDHVLYLSGLISNRDTIKLAGSVAAKTAPTWGVISNIPESFFDDPIT